MKMTMKQERRLVDALFDRAMSRKELAALLGVSQMTVGRIAERLLAKGILSERLEERALGRPARILSLNEARQYLILWVNEEQIDAACIRANGEILCRSRQPLVVGMPLRDQLADAMGRLRTALPALGCAEPVQAALVLGTPMEHTDWLQEELSVSVMDGMRDVGEICRELNQKALETE